VPTPFYHLGIAEELLNHPSINPSIRTVLQQQRGPFLLGNTAPDVQVISGDPRETTHFFTLPIHNGAQPPWEVALAAFPWLADTARLPEAQVAFITGYLCHLQADWLWVKEIFAPVFGPLSTWGSFRKRLHLHNVLRAYLDRNVVNTLPENTGALLDEVVPSDWLPFVKDGNLVSWRSYLAEQLKPGAPSQTVDVFAKRQGISPEEFYRLLDSEEDMDREVFAKISRNHLEAYRKNLVSESAGLVQTYMASSNRGLPGRSKPAARQGAACDS